MLKPPMVLLAAMPLVLLACTTVFEGTSETISLISEPTGANCRVIREGAVLANVTTPASVEVEKTSDDLRIVCEKEGYEDESKLLRPYYQDHWGNWCCTGLEWMFDLATGASYQYAENVKLTLTPTAEMSSTTSAKSTYEETNIFNEQTAVLKVGVTRDFWLVGWSTLLVTAIDGEPVDHWVRLPLFELVAEEHRIAFRYEVRYVHPVGPTYHGELRFRAEAGQNYELDATVQDDQFWSWIADSETGVLVAGKKPPDAPGLGFDDIEPHSSGAVAKATPETTQGPGEKWIFEIMEGQSRSSADRQIVSIVDNKFSVNVSTNGWRGNISGEIDHLGNLAGTGTIKRMGYTPRAFEFSASQSNGAFHTSVVIDAQSGSVTTITINLTRG